MPNLKEIRTRITSVGSTRQITSAMKMVSAAKLRKAQNAIIQIRPYSNKLTEIIRNLSGAADSNLDNVYAQQRDVNKILLIVVSSNRGLCGAFNSNIAKKVISLISDNYARYYDNGNLDVLFIGKKAGDILKKKKLNILDVKNHLLDHLKYEKIEPLALELMAYYKDKKYDRIDIIYNHFKNAASQLVVAEQFLPVKPEQSKNVNLKADYIFEPSKEFINEKLVPRSLSIQLYKAMLDSVASEHGARMTAMHKATDNASEMIKNLKLTYNKARQASITKEINEIVSGANALKG